MSAQNECSESVSKLVKEASVKALNYNWGEAIYLNQKALSKLKGESVALCRARIHLQLADLYATVGDFLYDLDSSQLGQLPLQGLDVGLDYFKTGLYHYRRAGRSASKANSPFDRIKATHEVARLKSKLSEFDSALYYFDLADRLYLTHINQEGLTTDSLEQTSYRASMLKSQGLNFYKQGVALRDTSLVLKSIKTYKNGVSVLHKSDTATRIRLSNNLGLAYLWLGIPDSSMVYYQVSELLARLTNDITRQGKAFYGLGESFEKSGRYDSAFIYFKLYDDSHDDVFRQEQVMNLAKFSKLYQIEQSEALTDRLRLQIIVYAMVVVLLLMLLFFLNRRRAAQNKLANQKINDLLQQQEINSLQGVLTGQEEERQRIATDLHDKLGAILGMVKLHFSAVEDRIDDLREDNKKQYIKANELLDQASSEVRNISHNLLSGVLVKFGLVPALQDLKDTVEATGKLKVQLVAGEQMDGRLSGEQELQIYRIVQELISNILKHSRGTEAVIQLNRNSNEINLIVQDNGTGFDVESAMQKKGIGLKNLQARVARLDAKLHFDSGKGAGTTVSIDIPIVNDFY
ncbi:MAG: sensor histidine kinase [Roseivirga sp.]|nr:sensor histidine kinase [Roseivirga sp.]